MNMQLDKAFSPSTRVAVNAILLQFSIKKITQY